MTSSRYRYDVVLRWAELSARAQEEPVRNLRRSRRTTDKWATCSYYYDYFGSGMETPPRYQWRKERPVRDVSPLPEIRNISSRGKRSSRRHDRNTESSALPKGVSGGTSGFEPTTVDRVMSRLDPSWESRVGNRETPVFERPAFSQSSPTGVSRRSFVRAQRNNEYISKRVSMLEEKIAKAKKHRDVAPTEEKRHNITRAVIGMSRGVTRLESERSDVPSAPREYKREYPYYMNQGASSSSGSATCSCKGYHLLCPTCDRCVFGNLLCPKCTRVLARHGCEKQPGSSTFGRATGPIFPSGRGSAAYASLYGTPSEPKFRRSWYCRACGYVTDGTYCYYPQPELCRKSPSAVKEQQRQSKKKRGRHR